MTELARDRAPLPLPPGRRAARRLLGRRAGAAGPGRVDGRVLEVPRHGRPRRLRRRAPRRPRRPACPSSSASRSTTTRAAWTRWPACWPATPSTSCWARCTGSARWRFDDLDDPVSMAEWSARDVDACWEAYTAAHGGAGRLGRLRRAGPPRPDQGGGPRARRPGRVVGPHRRGGGGVGHGGRGLLGRLAQAGRRAVPGRRAARALRRPRGAAHHGLGRPPPRARGRPGRRPARRARRRRASASLQGYRGRDPYPVAGVAGAGAGAGDA